MTRFLAPEIVGEVGVALVLVMTANQVAAFGLGQYVVNKPTVGRDVVFHATFYWLIFGAIALVGIVLLRHPLGPLFEAPGMVRYVPGLAMVIAIDRVAFMPERI